MLSAVPALLGDLEPIHSYTWAGAALLVGLFIYTVTRPKSPIDAIPAIGPTGFFSSYFSAWRFLTSAKDMLQEGYDKHRSTVFRVPEITHWLMVISDEKLIEEMRRAPDDVLSISEAIRDTFASDYTLGRNVSTNLYHLGIIRTQLTRNLGSLLVDVRDEIAQAFNDNIPAADGWVKVKALDTVLQVVARTSNRIFVGALTCRDPEYIALAIKVTTDVILGSHIINLFPPFLRPLAGYIFTNTSKSVQTGLKHLEPIITERQRKIDEYGFDYPDKPSDVLSWLMDEAKGEERTARNLTLRILAFNFVAIHTSSLCFTHALYHLASRPQYIEPIRAEIEAVVAKEGWSKNAFGHMRKLDSFLKESQRITGLGALSMARKALQPFTFSDGTRIPKGAMVASIGTARHSDERIYQHAGEFNGFRFSDIREEEGQSMKNQFAMTSADYLAFGHGRHACPGRFFAASELKAMMAHLLLNYDLKFENEGVRPADEWFGDSCVPNRQAEVLLRRRRHT